MRRRLMALLVPVLALLLLGVAVPFGALVAERATQTTYVDRLGDATRFASMVDPATAGGDTRLVAELRAYQALYDSPVWVLGLGGTVLHDPGHRLPQDAAFAASLQRAFAGDRATETATVWPWQAGPLHVFEPVGRDSQVTAVVVVEAPTAHLRADVTRTWAIGAAALLVPLAGLVVGIWPVTRWVLRPVHELETVAVTVRSGDLDARADAEQGPPELRELASTFNAMVDTVQRSVRRQRAFVSDAAHQLRNPLASLRLAVENLRPQPGDPDALDAYDDAVAETERMSETFEAMLAATELAGGDRIPDAEAWPLSRILEAGTPRWDAVLDAAGMTLEVVAPVRDVVLRQPPGGLSAVLDELVANAARLSGGTHVRVTVEEPDRLPSGAPEGAAPRVVQVVVADDGAGLPEGHRESATGRFWRAPHHQNVSGTGLGLAIVTDVLADAGGSLVLEQAEPHGLRAVVRLPVARPAR